ncbi:MAG: YfdX family protein [Desulfomonile tiedjei]|nr:YfdX family protein [Desulfomonile tiedjei]
MLKRVPALQTIIVGIFLFTAITVAQGSAEDRITHEYKVTPTTKMTDKEKQSLSLAASELLRHVNDARVDIKYAGGKTAAAHVAKALSLEKIIENALPEYQVSTVIKSGNLTYKNEEKRRQFIVPMYGELDEFLWTGASVKRPKKWAGGKEALEPSGDAEVRFTRTFLDVRDAKHYLEQTEDALKKNDLESADQALAAIQEHVISEYDEVDLPLLAARRSLMEAARAAADQKYNEAKQALKNAAEALEGYRAQMGDEVSKRTQTLAEEIKTLSDTLDQKKEGAVEVITSFWERVSNLF